MRSVLLVMLPCMAVVGAQAAHAHDGPRVWVGVEGSSIVTYSSDNDLDPATYQPSRLFTAAFESVGGFFSTEFPGFEVRRDGGGVAGGSVFGFGIAGPLLFFDSNAYRPVDEVFATPPQVALVLGSQFVITGGSSVDGFEFFEFGGAGDHSHLAFTYLGDGASPADGPDGVYALPLTLWSAGYSDSATFYVLLGKGVTPGGPLFDAAVDLARSTLVGGVPLPGDVDQDGDVDFDDLGLLLGAYDTAAEPRADFDTDGSVDFDDLGILLGNYGQGQPVPTVLPLELPPAADVTPIPESPATLFVALALAGLRRAQRQRRRA